MNTTFITCIIVLVITFMFVLFRIVKNAINNAYNKGYKQAQFDVTANMFDNAIWFSGNNKVAYDVLYLFAARYRKYKHVSAERFRETILSLDQNKLITNSSEEELDKIIS